MTVERRRDMNKSVRLEVQNHIAAIDEPEVGLARPDEQHLSRRMRYVPISQEWTSSILRSQSVSHPLTRWATAFLPTFSHWKRAVLLLAISALVGCLSPQSRLDALLKEQRFVEARALLEEEGVGAIPDPESDPEAQNLRSAFTVAIETQARQDVQQLISAGQTRRAREVAAARLAECPWSTVITDTISETDGLIAQIGDAERQWTDAAVAEDVAVAREFLGAIEPFRPWIMDSVELRRLEREADSAILSHWEHVILESDGRLDPAQLSGLQQELRRRGHADEGVQAIVMALECVSSLPRFAESSGLGTRELRSLAVARLAPMRNGSRKATGRLEACVASAWASHQAWIIGEFPKFLRHPSVGCDLLEEAERWISGPFAEPEVVKATARAHIHCASRIAPLGLASALAIFHLHRALELGVDQGDEQYQSALRVAEATLAGSPGPVYGLRVTLEPAIEPQLRGLVQMVVMNGLHGDHTALGELAPRISGVDVPAIDVRVIEAEMVMSTDGVRSVTSTYFSHYQDVPNPRKRQLSFACDTAQFDMNAKERAYNSAVTSHNIWPTNFSLNNVNYAYSAYAIAVNNYNALVSAYNAAPSTISESVFLPYSFEEGLVEFGWRVVVGVRIGGDEELNIRRESVVRDFVRYGSRGTDATVSYRSHDPLDIDVSAEAGFAHLAGVIEGIRQEINPALIEIGREPIAELCVEQQQLLGWIYHPWGMQPQLAQHLAVGPWARALTSRFSLEPTRTSPPPRRLTRNAEPIRGPLDPESASREFEPIVCRTHSHDPGETGASGSGVLVGPEGLVLTCAHVLTGSTLDLEFTAGPWQGTYKGDVVFVNRFRDVALVKAAGLLNTRWADLRLESGPRKGESIVAFGSPGIAGGGVNLGGVSAGVVSSPSVERFDSVYLSADISIASGSSGGPIVALSDGRVIGVVQAVATSPGIAKEGQGVSSTGFLCLAAPGDRLREWLGLEEQSE